MSQEACQIWRVRGACFNDGLIHEPFCRIREAFLAADSNKNGFVDREELAELLQLCNLAEDTAGAMLRRFDGNGDEEWSYKEFVSALKRKDYVAYQRGTPSPVKMVASEEAGPGRMPPRAAMKEPEERSYNLFTGHKLNQRVSPVKEVVHQYPVRRCSPDRSVGASPQPGMVAHGRRANRPSPDRSSRMQMNTGRDSVISQRYSEEITKGTDGLALM